MEREGERGRESWKGGMAPRGGRGTFTPVLIHLRDIRKQAAGNMPNRTSLTENST